MPMVSINPKTGPANVHYTISTPTCPSAEKINPQLPTLILIHPVYLGSFLFHPQFSDPMLRRFNLIGVDMRLHGDTEGRVRDDWRREDAADDVAAFMDALKLPPCHLLGVSMGACISLQTAVTYPEKVRSLFLVSPLPLQEPADVREGRQEIYDCWVQGWRNAPQLDEEALADAVQGALQLGFNNSNTAIGRALNAVNIPRAMTNFRPERFNDFHTATVKFFADREPHSLAKLKKLKCPVKLIQCGGDIAYPVHFAEELLQRLLDAGAEADLEVVEDAPHYGTVTHPHEINPLVHDYIMSHTSHPVPPPLDEVISPFEAELLATGWTPNGSEDEDSDDEFEICYKFETSL